ncbi:hypothetical protein Q5P01_003494 [Channa striata]|uniref:Cyclin-dependent kinase inhibitor domain-containing protein n=1 Tax=Channa striata TaxID=64152 RepID=A0AA88NG12_CHASR|nr:hypothetical protein Q5P01_003494 [Channa striata]
MRVSAPLRWILQKSHDPELKHKTCDSGQDLQLSALMEQMKSFPGLDQSSVKVRFRIRRWDLDMANPSTSTGGPAMESNSELLRLGGINDLNLKVGPVRRNLFGPVDHQQLQQDFERLFCMSVKVANKRWNFDFQTDKPGRGSNIEWEELRCQDVPTFYHSRTVRPVAQPGGAIPKGKRRTSSSSSEDSPVSSSSSGSGDEYLEVTTRGCYRVPRSGKRRQSAITDFFKVKKRRLLHYKPSSRQ